MKTHTDVNIWITGSARYRIRPHDQGGATSLWVVDDSEPFNVGAVSMVFTTVGSDPVVNMRRLRDTLSDHLMVVDPAGEVAEPEDESPTARAIHDAEPTVKGRGVL